MPLHVQTPLIESPSWSTDHRVLLKLENTQPSRSFKLRGLGRACEELAASGTRRFVSSSGGNAGYAVAWAGRSLGVPVTVVVPQTTPDFMRERIAALGAEVQVHGAAWHEAHALAQRLAEPADVALLHPFEGQTTWDGHATLVHELVAQGPKPDAVVLSVGGGGLFIGVAQGLDAVGWGDVPIVAVETEGAHSLHYALAQGRPSPLPGGITSVAKSLGAVQVSDTAFALCQQRPVQSVVVPDDAALAAQARFADLHGMLVEPACSASLAAAEQLDTEAGTVVVIVCGGALTRFGA